MTDDSSIAASDLEIPSSRRAAVLRVGISSSDETLVARLKEALTSHNVPFDVLSANGESAHSGEAPRYWARIQDWGVPGELALIVGDAEASRATGHALATHVFARKDTAQLVSVLEAALGRERARIERPSFLGASDTIQQVRARTEYVARFPDVSVLVLGETGTGKELVAQEIHRLTVGSRGPFVPVDCASIPAALFESELFGHEAGSVAGARPRTGLFEQAAGGTLFLDEIGEMPLALQPKLLRALETRRFKRVGSNVEIPLTARVVSATSRLVTGERHDGSVRRDLYYRLSSFTIALPALRDRTEDLAVLANRFMDRFAERYRLPKRELRDEAIEALAAHAWPGNVRELRAVAEQLAMAAGVSGGVGATEVNALLLERAPRTPDAEGPMMMSPLAEEVVSTSRPMTMVSPSGTSRLASTIRPTTAAGATLKELERDIVLEALSQSNGNLSRTARKLGIARSTLRHKLRRYGIETARAQDED